MKSCYFKDEWQIKVYNPFSLSLPFHSSSSPIAWIPSPAPYSMVEKSARKDVLKDKILIRQIYLHFKLTKHVEYESTFLSHSVGLPSLGSSRKWIPRWIGGSYECLAVHSYFLSSFWWRAIVYINIIKQIRIERKPFSGQEEIRNHETRPEDIFLLHRWASAVSVFWGALLSFTS